MCLVYSADFWKGTCHNRRGNWDRREKGKERGRKMGEKEQIKEIERMFIYVTEDVFSRNMLDKLKVR